MKAPEEIIYDGDHEAMVEVVRDTVGRHDTFNYACTSKYYEDMGYFGHINCSTNFNNSLEKAKPENNIGNDKIIGTILMLSLIDARPSIIP